MRKLIWYTVSVLEKLLENYNLKFKRLTNSTRKEEIIRLNNLIFSSNHVKLSKITMSSTLVHYSFLSK